MNEIDLYMSLIDEKEINSILKFFDQNVRSNNVELKKTKIKTIFRTNLSLKRGNGIVNPFISIIRRHKLSEWENFNEKEFFITLNKNIDKIPDYVKFANLILKYPGNKEKYIKKINENKESNKYIFDFNYNFNNQEEIIEYNTKLAGGQETILDNIELYIIKAKKLKLLEPNIKNVKDINSWNIVKLYRYLEEHNKAENMYTKFEYIKTHEDMDKDIINIFYLDIIFYLLSLFESSYINNNKLELAELKDKVNDLIKSHKELEKRKIKKEKEQNEIIKGLKKEILSYKSNKEELIKVQSEIKKHTAENKELLNQIDKLKNKSATINQQLKENKVKLKEYHNKITEIEQYYKYNFPSNQNKEKIFGIIHSTQIYISKIIFSEVEFIHVNDWKKQIKNVKKLYIQREGIEKKERINIKDYCDKHGIRIMNTISIYDEKNLIENISVLKNKCEVK